MSLRGQEFWVYYSCVADNQPVLGDLANHTIVLASDGNAPLVLTNNQGGNGRHYEVGGGSYGILISATEADCSNWVLVGTSTTTRAVIMPRFGNTDRTDDIIAALSAIQIEIDPDMLRSAIVEAVKAGTTHYVLSPIAKFKQRLVQR